MIDVHVEYSLLLSVGPRADFGHLYHTRKREDFVNRLDRLISALKKGGLDIIDVNETSALNYFTIQLGVSDQGFAKEVPKFFNLQLSRFFPELEQDEKKVKAMPVKAKPLPGTEPLKPIKPELAKIAKEAIPVVEEAAKPRRGRKPGSKNKPKT